MGFVGSEKSSLVPSTVWGTAKGQLSMNQFSPDIEDAGNLDLGPPRLQNGEI